jgi:diketogulonate reductase-like aldo/keto reductase
MDHVDLVLLHWPNPHVALHETLRGLARVREAGLARHVGLSNFTVALIEQAMATTPVPLVCNQIEYHPYLSQEKVLAACRHFGLAVVAYSPIARGRIKNDATLGRIAARHGKTPAQICLRWLMQQGVAAIPRTSKIERLSENIAIDDFILSDAEMAEIFALGSPAGRLTNYAFSPVWD